MYALRGQVYVRPDPERRMGVIPYLQAYVLCGGQRPVCGTYEGMAEPIRLTVLADSGGYGG